MAMSEREWWQDRNLTKLKHAWYKKLADSGFKDIENEFGDLKADASRRRMEERAPADKAARERYYTEATHHLFRTDWTGKQRARLIWALHSKGLGIRAICHETRWGFGVVRDAIKRERSAMAAIADKTWPDVEE
jgi:hypothetical protein